MVGGVLRSKASQFLALLRTGGREKRVEGSAATLESSKIVQRKLYFSLIKIIFLDSILISEDD